MKKLARGVAVILHRRNSNRTSSPHQRHAGTLRIAPAFGVEKRASTAADRGFTLIELVMVMVLIGVLAVFAVSRLDFQSTFSQRGFHDTLKAGLQFARKAAVAQRRYVCVTATATYVEFKSNPNVPEAVNVATLPGSCTSSLALPAADSNCGGVASRICAPSGVTITGANFWFDARGGSSAATTFTSTGQPDIQVENETGYVH